MIKSILRELVVAFFFAFFFALFAVAFVTHRIGETICDVRDGHLIVATLGWVLTCVVAIWMVSHGSVLVMAGGFLLLGVLLVLVCTRRVDNSPPR